MKITDFLNEKKDKLPLYGYIGAAVVLVIIILWLLTTLLSGNAFDQSVSGKTFSSSGVAMPPDKLYDDEKYDNIRVTVSAEIVEEELRSICKLVTEEYYFTQVETYDKETSIGPLLSTATIIYSYDGVVTAGIDCEKMFAVVDEDAKTLTITVPKAEVQYIDIDFDSFRLFEEKQGFWSKIKLADVNKSLAEFKDSAKKSAISKGILEKADSNVETVLSQAILSIPNTEEYTIKFVHE